MASAAERLVQHICNLVDPGQSAATDGQLLERWALGRDSRAFAALVSRHGALVWRVGRSVLHHTQDAEDVFQAVFFILARKAGKLRRRSSIAGWLHQTAQRLALKTRAAAARRLRREAHCAPAPSSNPLDELSVRDAQVILGEEMDRLPAEYREPILLCLFQGATQDQAARRLECSVRTLQRRLERGRNLLSQRLTRRGLAPASALAFTLCLRSELPAGLARQTVAAAAKYISGQAVSGAAAVLADGALRAVMVKTGAAYLTVFVALGGMALAGGFALTGKKVAPIANEGHAVEFRDAQPVVRKEPERRVDANGDPLPVGAVSRIGSIRFRHGGRVERILYTPDGKSLASTSSVSNTIPHDFINLWDAATGKLRWRAAINGIDWRSELAISADGKKLAVLNDFEYALVGTTSGKVLATQKWNRTADEDRARCLAIAPDLATFARGCFDATVRLHDAATGQVKARIVAGDKAKREFPLTMAFSASGEKLYVVVDRRPGILVFDTKTGIASQNLETPAGFVDPSRLIASPKRGLLARLDRNQIIIWALKSGKVKCRRANELPGFSGAFSADEKLFALCGNAEMIFLNTTTGVIQRRILSHPGVTSLMFAPDGGALAAADNTGCITLYDLVTGKPMSASPVPTGLMRTRSYVRFAGDASQILVFADSVDWWDVASAKIVRHLPWNQKWFDGDNNAQSIAPDGKTLAAYDGMYPDFNKGKLILIDAATGKTIRTLAGNQPPIVTQFSPDGTKLVSASPGENHFNIWDIATGKLLWKLKGFTGFYPTIAESPDGRWLATAATEVLGARPDYDIRLWKVSTGKLVHRIRFTRGSAFSMVFSADSKRLVSVGGQPGRRNQAGEVQLWDVATGTEVRSFTGHKERVTCVVITRDGRMLATGGLDNTLRLWEVASGKERTRIVGHETPVFSLDFSKDSRLLAAASMDAPVYIWNAYAPPNLKITKARLTQQDGEGLWRDLGNPDAAPAFHAICNLIAHPSEASAILEGGWRQLPRATAKQVRAWVDDLNSEQFAVRQTATRQLERFAAAHEDLLRQALKNAGSLEARQRLEKVLSRLDPERLRRERMLEVLEQVHTETAQKLLQELADQKDDPAMARGAATSLKRLLAQK